MLLGVSVPSGPRSCLCLAMPFHLGAGVGAIPSPLDGWALASCGPVENRLTWFDSPLCAATPF